MRNGGGTRHRVARRHLQGGARELRRSPCKGGLRAPLRTDPAVLMSSRRIYRVRRSAVRLCKSVRFVIHARDQVRGANPAGDTNMIRLCLRTLLASIVISLAARADESRCNELLEDFGSSLADAICFESADLTTANTTAPTTPADNSIKTLPSFAFTPITDRSVIAPSAGERTPIPKAVPRNPLDARNASASPPEAPRLLAL